MGRAGNLSHTVPQAGVIPATCLCPRRATAKDCLESSYFKEKPLRKYSPSWGRAGFGRLWALLTPLCAPQPVSQS